MNSISAQNFTKTPATRGLTGRLLPATLIFLLLTAVPALAEPVKVNQVVQTLTTTQNVIDLRINTLVQDPAKGTQQPGQGGESVAKTGSPTGKPESVISSVVVAAEGTTIGVEDIEDGEVEGTICDCGEIFIAGGAFPKWPFLFLGAIPLAFIDHDCDTCDTTVETPTPTPTPPSTPTPTPTPQVPEPASLLLFGTGLAAASAGLRRRYGKAKAEDRQ